jgi:hypothetical protein
MGGILGAEFFWIPYALEITAFWKFFYHLDFREKNQDENHPLRWDSSPTMGIISYDGNHHLHWEALIYDGIDMELVTYIPNLT